MQNFFAPQDGFFGDSVRLTGEEYHHATRACRVRVGEVIGVTDGRGRRVEARIVTITGSHLEAVVISEIGGLGEPSCEIILALSLIKPARFETAVEKCTELGVRKIIPLRAQRCEYSASRFNEDRLSRIALEAAKQSGRSWLPEIAPAAEIGTLPGQGVSLLVASQHGEESLEHILNRAKPEKLVLAVGPEGDFTPEEYSCFRDRGAALFSLGGLTLRSETAAIGAVARCVSSLR